MQKFLHLAYQWNTLFGEDKSALRREEFNPTTIEA